MIQQNALISTKPVKLDGKEYKASKDDPRYVVESDKSDKKAVHKPDALSKK